jgi:uncharacterized protein YbaR (Trm112 family)
MTATLVREDRPDVLVCPGCRGSYLHHMRIRAYDRRCEDDARVVRTTIGVGVEGAQLERVENDHSNPSSRRDGIVIEFWCENCDRDPELTIVQQKGKTFIEWR